jgi:hypothetical protein
LRLGLLLSQLLVKSLCGHYVGILVISRSELLYDGIEGGKIEHCKSLESN